MLAGFANAQAGQGVPEFWVRPGYQVTLAAQGLQNARFLQFGEGGTLYVSQPRRGNILSLKDENGDGVFERSDVFVESFETVHSMDFKDGWLYFTQASDGSCHRAKDTNGDGKADETQTVFEPGTVPSGGGHPFRGVLVGDDKLWITVSDPSNMTKELDSDRKTLYVFDFDPKTGKASNRRPWSTGIRNTEKIRFRPDHDGNLTDEIWGADHGSDWFGKAYGENKEHQPITDLNPPDELNHLTDGGFYGHPYLMADRTPRPEYVDRKDLIELAEKTTPAAWAYGAHWAANGFTFLARDYFPNHRGDLFQAFHGSWNRSQRAGYCVTRILFDPETGKPYGSLNIVECLSQDGQVRGRPVDVVEAPDGTLIFSDDQNNALYRISVK